MLQFVRRMLQDDSRLALNCGFRPAWVEIGAKKREDSEDEQ